MEHPVMNINLLPWREAHNKRQSLFFYSFSMFSILLILLGIFSCRIWILSQSKQLPIRPTFHNERNHALAALLRKRLQNQSVILETLVAIGQQIPVHCQLTKLTQDDNAIDIEGDAYNSEIMSLLLHRLKALHTVSSVTLKNITEQGGIHFLIQITIRALT